MEGPAKGDVSLEEDFSLEAPDLEPSTVFDPSTVLILLMGSVTMGALAMGRFGSVGAIVVSFATFYALYRLYRFVVNKLPPGYFSDKRLWIASKAVYYPGKPRKYPPLVK